MDQQEYLDKRVEDQIRWYSVKSKSNQNRHNTYLVIKLILAISIPVLSLFLNDFTPMKYIIGIVGASIALIEGIQKIYNYQDLWVNYRNTAEALKRERMLFDTKTGHYKGTDAFEQFVISAENIMSMEKVDWISMKSLQQK